MKQLMILYKMRNQRKMKKIMKLNRKNKLDENDKKVYENKQNKIMNKII